MEGLKNELKVKIISTLDLMDMTPEDMTDDAQLVGGEFGIDSIDVLELVIMIEQDYGVSIDTKELGEQVFRNIESLSVYIAEHRTN